jgi:hypothetical protein
MARRTVALEMRRALAIWRRLAAGIAHQVDQTGPASLGAADPVGVLGEDLVAALPSHLKPDRRRWVLGC